MPRLGIRTLPKPKLRYRPDRHQDSFESAQAARAEDALRAKSLRKSLKLLTTGLDAEKGKRLARLLEQRASGQSTRASLASSTYVRRVRVRMGGALWRLLKRGKLKAASTFTVASKKWIYTPEQLVAVDARKLKAALRQDLNRAGAGKVEGALIVVLHGEYEPESGYYVLHFHGVAVGEMVAVVDRLRKRKKYKPVPRGVDGRPAIKTPVRIGHKPLTRLPGPLTYILKAYWPSKRIGTVKGTDEPKRNRQHSRIKEPYHSQVLLWLDQWCVNDISLVMGMYVDKKGFKIRTNTRGSGRI